MNFILAVPAGVNRVFLVDSAVKAFILLALTMGISCLALKRASASMRHLALVAGMFSALAAPALVGTVPRWTIPRVWSAADMGVPRERSPGRATDAQVVASPYTERESSEPISLPSADETNPMSAPSTSPGDRWFEIVLYVWLSGAAVITFRLLAGHGALCLAMRRAKTITPSSGGCEGTVYREWEHACRDLGIHRTVRIAVSSKLDIPVAAGAFRPFVLLPQTALGWKFDRLRSVLLHELSHIRRYDAVSQWISHCVCAVYWFNPVAWALARRAAVEREMACDDMVLGCGVRPSAYASHLLEIVSERSGVGLRLAGLAMATRSSIESRLRAILGKHCSRRRVSWPTLAATGCTSVFLAVSAAAIQTGSGRTNARQEIGQAQTSAHADELGWGEPVNGLRAAVSIRLDPKFGPRSHPDLYVAIQNTTAAAIRLTDTEAPMDRDTRELTLKRAGQVKWTLGTRDPSFGDHTIEPQGILYIPIFNVEAKIGDSDDPSLKDHTVGSHIAQDALQDVQQTLSIEFQIEKAPAGSWVGKLRTGEATGPIAAGRPRPRDPEGQALFALWQHHARDNSDFPAGLIVELKQSVEEFIRNNAGDASGSPYASKMAGLLPRLELPGDRTMEDVASLIDAIAEVTPVPLDMMRRAMTERIAKTGTPLPQELKGAPWGKADPSGLRMAWLMTSTADVREGSVLPSRILLHNAGTKPVVFRAKTWHQGSHEARDQAGTGLEVKSVFHTTLPPTALFRLAPGEFVELRAPDIGIGNSAYSQSKAAVGTWVRAVAGNVVTVETAPISLHGPTPMESNDDGPDWWERTLIRHLASDAAPPSSTEARRQLAYRIAMDVFGTPLPEGEISDFLKDQSPEALTQFAKRLAARSDLAIFRGTLKSGDTTIRVLPAGSTTE